MCTVQYSTYELAILFSNVCIYGTVQNALQLEKEIYLSGKFFENIS